MLRKLDHQQHSNQTTAVLVDKPRQDRQLLSHGTKSDSKKKQKKTRKKAIKRAAKKLHADGNKKKTKKQRAKQLFNALVRGKMRNTR